MRNQILGGVVAAVTVAAVATGCSSTSPTPAPPAAAPSASVSSGPVAAEHNAADVAFAQGMIPHHNQAIEMSRLAPTRAASQEVKDLAVKIEQAQAPELNQMNDMLTVWGAPAPQPGSTAMAGMPMGGMMPGMMGEGQMQQLSSASGAAFDRAFLQMMIEHHTGAIQMAQTELAQGQSPQAEQLAQAIINDQQSEILQMQVLLGRV